MGKERSGASLEKICSQALSAVKKHISREPEVITDIAEVEGEWRVTVEALERKAVPDTQDLLGRYEVRIDKNGEVIGWTQKMVRKRSDKVSRTEEEPESTS